MGNKGKKRSLEIGPLFLFLKEVYENKLETISDVSTIIVISFNPCFKLQQKFSCHISFILSGLAITIYVKLIIIDRILRVYEFVIKKRREKYLLYGVKFALTIVSSEINSLCLKGLY